MDSLRDELELVTEKNRDLERRLQLAVSERTRMTSTLEEASDRILVLERHAKEQELRYHQSISEYNLPQERITIEERLDGKKIFFTHHHQTKETNHFLDTVAVFFVFFL